MVKWNWKRYVVGPNADGKSALLMEEATNVQEDPGIFYRATLWSADEVPVDNSIDIDRGADITTRSPNPGGMLVRAVEIPPDNPDREYHVQQVQKLHKDVGHVQKPSATDLARHPSMHCTDTLDCITCVIGEVYLITDLEELKMVPGDTVIIRGTNHGWSNKSDAPALLVGSMIDAIPLAKL